MLTFFPGRHAGSARTFGARPSNDIFSVRSRDAGAKFDTDERVDDSGDAPSNLYCPNLAVDEADPDGRTAYVVWEDDRSGRAAIFVARRRL